MKKLMTPPIAALVVLTGFVATLLANNFTPTRAAIWGTAWAIITVTIVRHELKRPGAHTQR